MRNTSTDSVSSQTISTSEASERTKSIIQYAKKTVKCCPFCKSYKYILKPSLYDPINSYYCQQCHSRFSTPSERPRNPRNSTKTQRQPALRIPKHLKPQNEANPNNKNRYELCEDCHKVFVPVSSPLINGIHICSNCAPKRIQATHTEQTIQDKYTQIRAAKEAV